MNKKFETKICGKEKHLRNDSVFESQEEQCKKNWSTPYMPIGATHSRTGVHRDSGLQNHNHNIHNGNFAPGRN